MGIGSVSGLSLAEARAEAANLKALIALGINPIEVKRDAVKAKAEAARAERLEEIRTDRHPAINAFS